MFLRNYLVPPIFSPVGTQLYRYCEQIMQFIEKVRRKLDSNTAGPLWPDAGMALRTGSHLSSHHYRHQGHSRRHLKRVPTSWLRQQLWLDESSAQIAGS